LGIQFQVRQADGKHISRSDRQLGNTVPDQADSLRIQFQIRQADGKYSSRSDRQRGDTVPDQALEYSL
jgi:hypothetical protein